jgi:outer membrane protein
MKRIAILGALGLALLVAGLVRVQAAGAPMAKIAFIDLNQTLNQTKVGKQALANLEAEKAAKEKQVNAKKEAFLKEVEELDKQRIVMKPDVVAKREAELQKKYVELQEYFLKQQQELSKKEAQLTHEIFVKASSIIESIAKRDAYTMVLERTESAILWADPMTDITAEVNARLDKGEGGKAK